MLYVTSRKLVTLEGQGPCQSRKIKSRRQSEGSQRTWKVHQACIRSDHMEADQRCNKKRSADMLDVVMDDLSLGTPAAPRAIPALNRYEAAQREMEEDSGHECASEVREGSLCSTDYPSNTPGLTRTSMANATMSNRLPNMAKSYLSIFDRLATKRVRRR